MKVFVIFMNFYLNFVVNGITPPSWNAKRGEAPFMVYLDDGYGTCGGSIITKEIVITAGHCLVASLPDHHLITVLAGAHDIFLNDKKVQRRSIEKTLVHDKYKLGENGVQAYYDIALIKVSVPFEFNEFISPITFGSLKPHQIVYFYGYGSVNSDTNEMPYMLLGRNISVIPDQKCKELLKKTQTKSVKQNYEICLEHGFCHGDSGGPAIQIHKGIAKLIGIISWTADDTITCNISPAVVLDVTHFGDWLRSGLKKLGQKSVNLVLTLNRVQNDSV